LSSNGYNYYILVFDDFSRYSWLYPFHKKSDVFSTFIQFQKLVENLFNTKIAYFQRDGGKEYDNVPFRNHLVANGIYFYKSAPLIQQQNGVAKRKHRPIVELTRTMLMDANMANHFRHDAVLTAVYVINRLLPPLLNGLSPFFKLFSKSPLIIVLEGFQVSEFS